MTISELNARGLRRAPRQDDRHGVSAVCRAKQNEIQVQIGILKPKYYLKVDNDHTSRPCGSQAWSKILASAGSKRPRWPLQGPGQNLDAQASHVQRSILTPGWNTLKSFVAAILRGSSIVTASGWRRSWWSCPFSCGD